MFIAGVTMMNVTTTYVSGATGLLTETLPLAQYRPLGWFGIGFGLFNTYLTCIKALNVMENKEIQE